MTDLVEQEAIRAEFIRRSTTETGFCARRLLGYDYDLDEATGAKVNAPHGGIRDVGPDPKNPGPHSVICAAMDSGGSNVLILAPRGSYKSTIAQARIIRGLLSNKASRVLYGMDVAEKAEERVGAIREVLETNTLIHELWGDQRGSPWRRNRFNVAGAPGGRLEASLQHFGVDKPATGGHYDLIILDDLVNHINSSSPDGIAKVKACFRQVSPLLVNGGQLIVLGTRYADDDLYGWILREMADVFRLVTFDAGCDVVVAEDGSRSVKGTPRFPHLTVSRLDMEFKRMGGDYVTFASQYLNKIVSGLHQRFSRHHFHVAKWDPATMDTYTGWLLTDTATSLREDGCFSVLAYVLFSPTDDAYLADLRVGHMSTVQFTEAFFEMLRTWSPRVYHIGEVWENIALNTVWRSTLDAHPLKGAMRLRPIGLSRHRSDEKAKKMRIAGLEGRFHNGRFYVLDTVPRTFADLSKVCLLFDPEAEAGEDGARLPGGELVDEFIHFPRHQRRDIPDTLAILDETNSIGGRVCAYCTPRHFLMHRNNRPQKARSWRAGAKAPARSRAAPPAFNSEETWVQRLGRQV